MFEKLTWFGNAIAAPILASHTRAEDYLLPSKTLTPHQRLEIYHQQYWWRLLRCLQENFPFVTRLFGHKAFNERIATPYIAENPPSHWALNQLGDTLHAFLEKNYSEDDRELVLAAVEIDWNMQKSFWIGAKRPADFSTLSEELLEEPLSLQPHIHLFHYTADLFTFREKMMEQEVEYWNDHPFPELTRRECYFVVSRSLQNVVQWKEISSVEYKLLSKFAEGSTINDACEKIEGDVSDLPLWFAEWTKNGWFIHHSNDTHCPHDLYI